MPCGSTEITLAHLPSELVAPVPVEKAPVKKEPLTHCSEDSVRKALEKTAWNKAKAARILGVGRQTLYRKLSEYNIADPVDE